MKRIEPGDICENGLCDHAATLILVGDGGSLAHVREYMQAKWCDCCALDEQIAYAKRAVVRLDELERERKTACSGVRDA